MHASSNEDCRRKSQQQFNLSFTFVSFLLPIRAFDNKTCWVLHAPTLYILYNFIFTVVGATQLEGFKLYIYNSTNSHPQEVLEVQETVEGSNEYMVEFGKIQNITDIRLTLNTTLSLCEVQVFARKYETRSML